MTDPIDPAAALAAIRTARDSVETRVSSRGWHYDIPYAAIVAVMVGAQALPPLFSILGSVLGVTGLLVMFRAESRRTGVRILGTTPRRARWVAIGLGGVMVLTMLGLVYVRHNRPDLPLGLITAGVMVVVFSAALTGSRLWRRVFRAEMRGLS
jgi:hypothetical protein